MISTQIDRISDQKQFTIKFDILTQTNYESDLIGPEIENQSNDIQLIPKLIYDAIYISVIIVSNLS